MTLAGLLGRLRSGWDPEDAIATPPRTRGGGKPSVFLKAFGERKSVSEWSRDPRCKVTLVTLLRRIDRGMLAEEAISTPPFGGSRRKEKGRTS